jgi:CheY-like chemotaxis protein
LATEPNFPFILGAKKMNTVLCIDDDSFAIAIQTILFKQIDFCDHIITKSNGEEAIAYFEGLSHSLENPIDLPRIIFLDLNMPVMDGWGFLDAFKEKFIGLFPDTLIYILTSSLDPEDQLRAAAYSFVKDFISKPITKEILRTITKNLDLQKK